MPTEPVMHPVVRKLSLFSPFNAHEERALALAFERTFTVGPKEQVVSQDEVPVATLFLIDGVAARHKVMPDGRDQVLSFMLPGDSCDVGISLLDQRDDSITTLSSPATFASSSPAKLQELSERYPRIRDALTWSTLVEEAIAREWIVNVGQRSAEERMAHLFCELHERMKALGQAEGGSFVLPLTQQDLGAALALSAVHINRTLQNLRARRLVTVADHRVRILDETGLWRLAMFDPGYLHLEARYAPQRDQPA
jgi:CRP-like cAMP-binding protein